MPKKINDFVWEIGKEENPTMNVPIHIYANEKIMQAMGKDRTLKQAMNAASLPSIVKHMLVMPDGHEGYGFPVGGVAAFPADDGIISPGSVGYDINCGVRLIKTNLTADEIKPKLSRLMDVLMKNVPSGVGSKINLGFTPKDLEKVATEGVKYIVEKGFGFKEDVDHIEEYGTIAGADFSQVSTLAKKRGVPQMGTLGAGNHFVEVQRIDEIFDAKIAKGYGLEKGDVTILIHSGSRGFGHQICSDYLRTFSEYQQKNNIKLPDPELSYAFVQSKEAQSYLGAMRCAVNYAFTNRQIMTNSIRKSFEEVFEKSSDSLGMELLYDVAHNIAKLEEHDVDGNRMKLYVHRKGATRAFGPGRDDIPKKYKHLGQPVLIPGSMGSASYVLAGREEAMTETFGSSCHGSGRVMSRHQAIRDIPTSRTLGDLKTKGIEIRVRDKKLISEEAEWAYKDVNEVVQSIAGAKISNIVAKLVPLGVAKG
jgi:tRNA-splicing ligase RtcB (3'-phosphate/5'-hydroxy nucleic acid ligase)